MSLFSKTIENSQSGWNGEFLPHLDFYYSFLTVGKIVWFLPFFALRIVTMETSILIAFALLQGEIDYSLVVMYA